MSAPSPGLSPLPPVEQVRPGLWSVPVPIPNNPLRYVFVYAFETERGPYIVDAGWNTDDAYATLCSGLAQAGFDIATVQGVLVTHIHPDHYGLAGRVREASGAWVGLHSADAALIHDRYEVPEELIVRVGTMLRRVGAPPDELASLERASMPVLPFVTAVKPDLVIEDGDKPEVPGWDLVAIWTPGHSPGHLCFWEPRNALMLSGDHVLPRITPNIPFHPQAGADPLGDFLRSLERLEGYQATEVLPAHEHRFVGLQSRLAELRAHHERRFAEVVTAVRDGTTTAWDIASHMQWSRPWDRIQGFMRRAAVGEAMAHLRALEARGVLREVPGEPSRWELARE
ncbi:MAG: MBL fold metallo-hydrolase [Actinobacteria bacterium]|nr:MAG: MBL fold metallo-hydrolase [Actinomycetota bacterium]